MAQPDNNSNDMVIFNTQDFCLVHVIENGQHHVCIACIIKINSNEFNIVESLEVQWAKARPYSSEFAIRFEISKRGLSEEIEEIPPESIITKLRKSIDFFITDRPINDNFKYNIGTFVTFEDIDVQKVMNAKQHSEIQSIRNKRTPVIWRPWE